MRAWMAANLVARGLQSEGQIGATPCATIAGDGTRTHDVQLGKLAFCH